MRDRARLVEVLRSVNPNAVNPKVASYCHGLAVSINSYGHLAEREAAMMLSYAIKVGCGPHIEELMREAYVMVTR